MCIDYLLHLRFSQAAPPECKKRFHATAPCGSAEPCHGGQLAMQTVFFLRCDNSHPPLHPT